MATSAPQVIYLDGDTLSIDTLYQLGQGGMRLDLTPEAWERVAACRKVVDDVVSSEKRVYGINTGFGKFATVPIETEKLSLLQRNLIVSHAAGTGAPLSPERTRMMFTLRINVLAKGYSGIRPETLKKMIAFFNADCLSMVPEKGTVGASGDLAPLSHLALGMLGEGKMWHASTGFIDATEMHAKFNLSPIDLKAKEGLALINGTQFITSITALAAYRAKQLALQSDIVAALMLDVMMGTPKAFDPMVNAARPHNGQIAVATRLRHLLHSERHPSEIYKSHAGCGRVQDAYTMRCTPQVHGIAHDTVDWVWNLLTTEMNSATDNPMIFAETGKVISAGNFHGEYPAKAADYLAIGITELANVSERRIERMVNPHLNEDLPGFLVNDGGLNSGFMLMHCTAAALASENKGLCHPASIDSISTSAAKEDHVSMGGYAARKAMTVVENVETVVAIELLAACQALEFRRPLRTTEPLEKVYELVRTVVKPLDVDRYVAPDIEAALNLIRTGAVYNVVKKYIDDSAPVDTSEIRVASH